MKAVKDTMNISMSNCMSSVLITCNCLHAPTGHLIDFLFRPSPKKLDNEHFRRNRLV